MTIQERAERAVELKAHCNCAQAVALAFADELPLDEETISKLAAGYGAGMGCMEATCGALVGAVMAAGLLTDGQGTARYAKTILADFRQRCGAAVRKDLKQRGEIAAVPRGEGKPLRDLSVQFLRALDGGKVQNNAHGLSLLLV